MMKSQSEAISRALALKSNLDFSARSRTRFRAIANGGAPAIRALLGDSIADLGDGADLPWPNLMISGMTRLAQKIGHLPKVRVPAPETEDAERPRKRAEKRERTVDGFDEMDRLELQMPQAARWTPGYGFTAWTVSARRAPNGMPYPAARLRDSYDCYPGAWGIEQQPLELAIWRLAPLLELQRLYPDFKDLLETRYGTRRRSGGAVILGGNTGWANQTGVGIEIVEYYDEYGCHMLIPGIDRRVDYHVNPLDSGPSFVIGRRFAFDQLVGQYDHSVGLMATMAKINILSYIAMEDAVMAPTNVSGDMDAEYRWGRLKVNYLPPGTKVDRPVANLPYQLFESINRIERQFRLVSGYPIQDDAQSPNSWATGEGLRELQSGIDGEVDEYHKVFRWALQDLDAKRLEWDEKVSPFRRKPVGGRAVGVPHTESYTPAKDIAGDYRTTRPYGLMAAWDDSAKVVGGLQLLAADVIDVLTLQENLSGLDNLTRINERVADKKFMDTLLAALAAAAQSGDMRAVMALVEAIPDGELKSILEKYFMPPEEPQAQAMAPDPMAALGGGGGGPPPDVTTVLSRLTGAGATQGGAQTVAQV